ncbi:MAG: inorganic phosphate transporter, partial [Bacteroidales bacterium]|nr:inorganic phosphate transporter [Bacteroidales bacterium]
MNIFLIIVIILVILAVSDLIVGVSNDAVNFLNSAIGSKVAPLRVILIVSAMGILVGATFSSGMMEVARKGIFYPKMFSFENIMIIFLAVMLTDIILLDLFNTFGLPTSTTVSIVFELLGSAVGMAVLRIHADTNLTLAALPEYINSAKALAIISGILLSVVVAFSVGALVQYISRLLFSFNFNKTIKYFGAIWGGLAITAITYFILIKGAKGSTLIKDPQWIKDNTMLILLAGFAGWTILSFLLQVLFKVNILKLIVLVGTFALAMAFAGNDLVNFIGVPLAGIESYNQFMDEGGVASEFMMQGLAGKVATPTMYLLIAGLIMVMTLWFSKKAKSVVKTTLNLSDQDVTQERFESSMMARTIVRQSIKIGNVIKMILPVPVQQKMASRFDATYFNTKVKKETGVTFDLVRASVNLIVASILIAIGTSLKLPLSTTYVTFMVAMGTSLADGAWDRESAVYRITGVVTVVGGWFFTALSAFTVSFVVVLFLSKTFPWGMALIIPLVLFVIYKTHIAHKKKASEEVVKGKVPAVSISENSDAFFESFTNQVVSIVLSTSESLELTVQKTIEEKRRKLKEVLRYVKDLDKESKELKKGIPKIISKFGEDALEFGQHYVEVIDFMREAMHCLNYIAVPMYKHVDNAHKGFTEFQSMALTDLSASVKEYSELLVQSISKSDYAKGDVLVEKALHVADEVS